MRTLTIKAKCVDRCHIDFVDTEKQITNESDGYVPRNIGIGGGDYIKLIIDVETGQILNWLVPENEDIQNSMEDNIYE